MSRFRRQAARMFLQNSLAPGVLALAMLVHPIDEASAQTFDPNALSVQDQQLMQQMLEGERSHVARSLPVSEQVFTIIRTETQPRICRYFVLQELAGNQLQGVGCRVGSGQWQLAASISDMGQAPAPTPSASSDVAPRTITVLRPTPSAPSSAPPANSPATWTSIPVPARRPEQTVLAGSTDGGQEAEAETAPAIPPALAAVPLPTARPAVPASITVDAQEDAVGTAPSIENGDPEAGPPLLEETELATDDGHELNIVQGPEIAQGDTDLEAEIVQSNPEEFITGQPAEADPVAEPAPIATPLPARRP